MTAPPGTTPKRSLVISAEPIRGNDSRLILDTGYPFPRPRIFGGRQTGECVHFVVRLERCLRHIGGPPHPERVPGLLFQKNCLWMKTADAVGNQELALATSRQPTHHLFTS